MPFWKGLIIVLIIIILLIFARCILDYMDIRAENYRCSTAWYDYPTGDNPATYSISARMAMERRAEQDAKNYKKAIPAVQGIIRQDSVPTWMKERLASVSTVTGAYTSVGPVQNMSDVRQYQLPDGTPVEERMDVLKQIREARNMTLDPGASEEANQQKLLEDVEFSHDSA